MGSQLFRIDCGNLGLAGENSDEREVVIDASPLPEGPSTVQFHGCTIDIDLSLELGRVKVYLDSFSDRLDYPEIVVPKLSTKPFTLKQLHDSGITTITFTRKAEGLFLTIPDSSYPIGFRKEGLGWFKTQPIPLTMAELFAPAHPAS